MPTRSTAVVATAEDKTDSRSMPQLDSLRAVAVGCVMLLHFPAGEAFGRYLPLDLGVELFFVISGFLITGIVLKGAKTINFIENFYLRRALRLFPLYYIVVVMLTTYSHQMREAFAYYALYGVNIWVVKNQTWGIATHFWSLSVEEQFYLIWPFAVLWTPRRVLKAICIALVGFGFLFRLVAVLITQNLFTPTLLPGCIDALACGALLTLWGPQRVNTGAMIAAAASAAAVVFSWRYAGVQFNAIAVDSLALPLFYVVVGGAARGFSGASGWFLSLAPLRYIGRISYGLYVIHYFVPTVLKSYAERLMGLYPSGFMHRAAQFAIIAAFATISLALAALSWHFLENPINRNRDAIIGYLRKTARRVSA